MLEDSSLNNQGGFDEKPTPPPLNKNQKFAVAGLAVFAIFILVMWFAQLRSNIYGPFNSNNSNGQNQIAAEDENSDEALKAKDTDGDGLNNYDELNIYNTSPYLEDSDGDTLKDGEEIKAGTDPNCPKGRTCSEALLEDSAANQTTGGSNATVSPDSGLNNLLNQSAAQTQTQAGTENLTADQLNALKNIDAASLRQLLIQAGMDKTALDKISDAELLKSYGETFNSAQ